MPPAPTTDQILPARRALVAAAPLLARVVEAVPPFEWRLRTGGFEGLFRMIVEQQVSVAAAASIWRRVGEGLGDISPESVLARTPDELRSFGLSGQKARYGHEIARAHTEGRIDFDHLEPLAAAAAMATPVHSALVRLGLVAEDAMARPLADSLSLPLAVDNDYPDEAVLPDLLTESFLRTCQVLPLSVDGQTVTVAVADPHEQETIRALEMRLDCTVRAAVATPTQLRHQFDRLYGEAIGHQDMRANEQIRAYIEL